MPTPSSSLPGVPAPSGRSPGRGGCASRAPLTLSLVLSVSWSPPAASPSRGGDAASPPGPGPPPPRCLSSHISGSRAAGPVSSSAPKIRACARGLEVWPSCGHSHASPPRTPPGGAAAAAAAPGHPQNGINERALVAASSERGAGGRLGEPGPSGEGGAAAEGGRWLPGARPHAEAQVGEGERTGRAGASLTCFSAPPGCPPPGPCHSPPRPSALHCGSHSPASLAGVTSWVPTRGSAPASCERAGGVAWRQGAGWSAGEEQGGGGGSSCSLESEG